MCIYELKKQLTNEVWNLFVSNFDNNNPSCSYHVVCSCCHCSLTHNPPVYGVV